MSEAEQADPRPGPPSVITVRLSAELHVALKEAAHRRRMSLNAWCAVRLADCAEFELGLEDFESFLTAKQRERRAADGSQAT